MLLSLDVHVVHKLMWAGIHRDWRACRMLSNNRKKAGRLMLRSWFGNIGNVGNCAWSASTAVLLALCTRERRDRAWKVVGQIKERVVLPEVRNWHGKASIFGQPYSQGVWGLRFVKRPGRISCIGQYITGDCGYPANIFSWLK